MVAAGIDASYIHVLDGQGVPVWKQATGSPAIDVEFLQVAKRATREVATIEEAVLCLDESRKGWPRNKTPLR